jgi:hypothetical protein
VLDRLMGEALTMARRVQRLSGGVRAPSLGDLAAERVLGHPTAARLRWRWSGLAHDRRCVAAAAGAGATAHRQSHAAAAEGSPPRWALKRCRWSTSAGGPALAAVVPAAAGGEPILDAATSRLAAGGAPLLIDFAPPTSTGGGARGRSRPGRHGTIHRGGAGRRPAELMRLRRCAPRSTSA